MATQLPNPQILSHALNTISTECVKLANLPALDQGAAILQQLTQMNQQMGQMNQRMDQMNQRMDQMNQRMDQRFNSLEIAIRAMNQNSIARTQNSLRGFPDQELVPLVNAITAVDIPGFPTTPSELNHASAATLNPILSALGLSTGGNAIQKRKRLGAAIGLKV